MTPTQQQIVSEALRWVGTPFRHLGRTKAGVDCVGFPLLVYKAAGLLPSDYQTPHYPLDGGYHGETSPLDDELLTLGFDPIWLRTCLSCPVRLPELLPGDLLTMQMGRHPYHAALVIDQTAFLHAHPTAGVIQSDLRDWTYLKRIRSVWRIT